MGNEPAHVIAAILILFVITGVGFVLVGDYTSLSKVFVFSFVVVMVNVFAKKGMAYLLDARAEHKIWHVYRFGIKEHWHFKKPRPAGLFVPLFLSLFSLIFSLGVWSWKVMTLLTYEARALKHRAAKRFGHYSYTEMTDWHNGLIGVAGIVVLLVVAVVSYLPGLEYLTKMAAYYAFWNMIPISDLDGTQIYFGNRILWFVLAAVTLIFGVYAMML